MRTIGLLGGMSWESTQSYYQQLNQQISQQLGALHSAQIVMWSVDFQQIETLQRAGQWQVAGDILAKHAVALENAGAECVVIATNTMHIVADQVQREIKVPLLHIADATANRLVENRFNRVGLLGTAFTMEKPFYKARLQQNFGIDVVVPDEAERQLVHDVIYQELCLGQIKPESKQAYLAVIEKLEQQGAQAIILGCTEIGLLVAQQDTRLPLIDTVSEHVKAAVKFALS